MAGAGSGTPNNNKRCPTLNLSSIPEVNENPTDKPNDDSQKKLKMTHLQPEILNIFECPVCFDYVLPPILQCPSGHLICKECRPQLGNVCPSCRGALGKIRNLALEKIAEFTNFPCKFNQAGCNKIFLPEEKIIHEKECTLRSFKCPCPGNSCKWSGPTTKLLEHLASTHDKITTLHGEDIIFLATGLDIDGVSMDWVMLQSCLGHHFLLALQKQHRNISHSQYYIQVLFLGPKEANKFKYKVELDRNGRKLTFESIPKSLDDLGGTENVFRSDGLHFEETLAKIFIDSMHHMNIGIIISLNGQ